MKVCFNCKINKPLDEYIINKYGNSKKTCLNCDRKIPTDSFLAYIRNDYIDGNINTQPIIKMLLEDVKMIMDEYNFIFINYVLFRNLITQNKFKETEGIIQKGYYRVDRKERSIENNPIELDCRYCSLNKPVDRFYTQKGFYLYRCKDCCIEKNRTIRERTNPIIRNTNEPTRNIHPLPIS